MSKTAAAPIRPLTDLELEIMTVVWELREGTVRHVYEALRERRKIAYTTVLTMMNLLVTKGHLRKEPCEGRAFLYRPVHARRRVVSRMVDDFVGRLFDGSAGPLVLSLIRDRKITRRELDEIARFAEEAE